ncbi:MAG: ATP-binding cassette domain-containing protein [Nitrospinaceae bacterium]|nr:ATP-binding cassette domain-containing protein [Nitrospinaceae bacterium]
MALIEVRNLIFEYPGKRALENVSFTIDPGSVTALVGPNGAGKTTLMNCLAAMARPVSGEITLQDISVLDQPRECHRKIGYLPDFFGLYDDLTVRQSLQYMALAQKIPQEKVEDTVDLTARRVHLSDRLNVKAGNLSRGLRQRLAIGQAIIHNPPIILLDEPASGLDPKARHQLAQLLLELRDEGKTLMVSSHILTELQDYSTHMMVIHDGQLAEHTSIEDHETQATRVLVLKLCRPAEGLAENLNRSPKIRNVEGNGRFVEFIFEGTDMDQHRLLKELLGKGWPVSSLAVKEKNLQETYLEKFGAHPHAS